MSFLKDMKIKGKFKKGYLVGIGEMPDKNERARFLADFAVKNNIPIIIGKQPRWDELKFANVNVEIMRLAPNFTFEVKQADTSRGVLVDESVVMEMVTWLREQGIEIKGGFSE